MDGGTLAVTDASTVRIAHRDLHYRRFGTDFTSTPVLFLHEGLGSVELWRDFPNSVVEETLLPGLAYSRHGNGWSSPLGEPRRPEYMHEEALETLPRVVDELVGRPPIIVGHSDGASIAIIYSGSGYPVEGLVLIAPHVFVEPETIESIASLRSEFPESELPEKMAKYHIDPARTFYGWADVWLSPSFRSWNIESYVSGVRCPTLLIQGDADEYGTTNQLDAIDAGLASPSERLIVGGAGHSPHLAEPELVSSAVVDFTRRLG
jgi:pimeloyl-ACP methyl ester carboxylesterase